MFEKFDNWNPYPETLALVQASLDAFEDMRGFEPTLRSIYYQLVANDFIPNKQSEYKRLVDILTKARNAGLFPWDALIDKGRSTASFFVQPSVTEALYGVEMNLALDYWEDQDCYVEMWVEKQAQEGVVKRVSEKYSIPWMSCKGYLSATAAYDAGQRFREADDAGKRLVLIHLGDHDPSGIDMTRDNRDRIEKYAWLDGHIEVDRVALNMDQIEEHHLTPDPVKFTDSRATGYEARFGKESWELDALKPQIMLPILEACVQKHVDVDKMIAVQEKEREMRADLEYIGDNPGKFLDIAREDRTAEDWD